MNTTTNSSHTNATGLETLYPSAVAVPVFALPAFLLCIPPLFALFKARNLAATILVTGVAVVNLQNFINALIWSNDPLEERWSGKGLCDVEVKLYIGVGGAIVGATASIFRQLAIILNTNNTSTSTTRRQRNRNLTFELFFCIVLPTYLMAVHYVVQPNRYWLVTISGCTPSFDSSWPSYVLVFMWPVIIASVAAVFCCLAVFRFIRYRREVGSILASSSSITKARYIRLFMLALLLLAAYLPLSIYTLVSNLYYPQYAYSWSAVHPPNWSGIINRQSLHRDYNGFDRWVQIGTGYALFLFFGTGHEAMVMYKAWWARATRIRNFPRFAFRDKIFVTRRRLPITHLHLDSRPSEPISTHGTGITRQIEPIKSDFESDVELGILQSPRRF